MFFGSNDCSKICANVLFARPFRSTFPSTFWTVCSRAQLTALGNERDSRIRGHRDGESRSFENCALAVYRRAAFVVPRMRFRASEFERAKKTQILLALLPLLNCAARAANALLRGRRGIFRRVLRSKWRRGWIRSNGRTVEPSLLSPRKPVVVATRKLEEASLRFVSARFFGIRNFREFDFHCLAGARFSRGESLLSPGILRNEREKKRIKVSEIEGRKRSATVVKVTGVTAQPDG